MGYPLVPTLVNAFLVHRGKNHERVVHSKINYFTRDGTLMTYLF